MVESTKRIKHKARVFALGVLMLTPTSNLQSTPTNTRVKTELSDNVKRNKGTNYDKVKINTMDDLNKLFDLSLDIIFCELVLEEVPMTKAYDDHGKYKGTMNTVGLGSTFAPTNIPDLYDDSTAVWYAINKNPKTFWKDSYSYEEMLQLVIGWGKYRKTSQDRGTGKQTTGTTVLQKMFKQLKGCSLRPNEFAALFCACYNSESNITNLCPKIKQHYTDPIKCANLLRTWGTWNGLKKRCGFESLVYLNNNDFCKKMLGMPTCPGLRASCIFGGTVVPALTKQNYKNISENYAKRYLSTVYKQKVITPEFAHKKLGKYFNNPLQTLVGSNTSNMQSKYEEAIKEYDAGNYKKALKRLLELEQDGASGPDLYNDIAITYYNLEQYDNCITYCKKVLKTDYKSEFAKACYNAGLAYEAKRNYDRASLNFEQASHYYDNYGVSNPDSSVNYKAIYEKAKKRAKLAAGEQQVKNKQQPKNRSTRNKGR